MAKFLEASSMADEGSKEPKLLSGGNPRIPKGYGDAPVQAYIAAMPEWKQDVGRRIDEVVTAAVPGVKKAIKWNSPFYGVERQGYFLSYHCFKRYVKIAFHNGGQLDPKPPVNSKQNNIRYLHIHENDEIDDQFTDWVKQASELPGEKL